MCLWGFGQLHIKQGHIIPTITVTTTSTTVSTTITITTAVTELARVEEVPPQEAHKVKAGAHEDRPFRQANAAGHEAHAQRSLWIHPHFGYPTDSSNSLSPISSFGSIASIVSIGSVSVGIVGHLAVLDEGIKGADGPGVGAVAGQRALPIAGPLSNPTCSIPRHLIFLATVIATSNIIITTITSVTSVTCISGIAVTVKGMGGKGGDKDQRRHAPLAVVEAALQQRRRLARVHRAVVKEQLWHLMGIGAKIFIVARREGTCKDR